MHSTAAAATCVFINIKLHCLCMCMLLPVVQGSFMLVLGSKGLAAFAILYTLGNVAAFCRRVTYCTTHCDVCCDLMYIVHLPVDVYCVVSIIDCK